MRRLAKGSSAQSFDGSGSAGNRLDGRSLATRGAFGRGKGSGAPSRRLRSLFAAPLAVAAMALAFGAGSASAANPPTVTEGITIPSDTSTTFATLGGTINPQGQATSYHFEYGKTAAYGDSAPAVDASAGSGSTNISVYRAISELEPDAQYHYRLVATNASGTTFGPDLTFYAGPDLGFGMHYEMVSPPDTNGSPTVPKQMAVDGSRVNLQGGAQGFADAQSQHGLLDTYMATRTSNGWVTNAMTPPQNPTLDNRVGSTWDMTKDLSTQLVYTSTLAQLKEGTFVYRLLRPGDLTYKAFPAVHDYSGQAAQFESEGIAYWYGGASEDLNHLVFVTTTNTVLLPGLDPVAVTGKTQTSFQLYEIIADPPTLRRVTTDSAGQEMTPVCGAAGGGGYSVTGGIQGRGQNAISADGSKIFFGTKPGNPPGSCSLVPGREYVRINGTTTVELSASECQPACATPLSEAAFAGATDDGSSALFTTEQQLVNADLDTTRDLYRYDFAKPAGQHLSLVSKGDVTPGNGAQVQNVVEMSEDGSRIYFVAKGVLTNNLNSYGKSAQAGANNLYLYEPASEKTTFITSLDAADSQLWGAQWASNFELPGTDGRFALMSVTTKVGTEDTDSVTDLYRYDAQTGQLLQVTPGNTADGVEFIGGSTGGENKPPALNMSADGSTIAFITKAALQARDVNGINDVYMWKDGTLSLISNGTAKRVPYSSSIVSPGGDQVAFATRDPLVPKDVNSYVSTYVARTGADVEPPIVPPTPPCNSSELCRGSAPPAPVLPGPATPGFVWPGNDPTPAPTAQPHKKHKKKQQHKKKQHKKHRASRHSTHRAG